MSGMIMGGTICEYLIGATYSVYEGDGRVENGCGFLNPLAVGCRAEKKHWVWFWTFDNGASKWW